MGEKFGRKVVGENGKGLGVYRELCSRERSGGMSGMVNGDSETFRLDNLESEVVK
jgi:hypothetical protein